VQALGRRVAHLTIRDGGRLIGAAQVMHRPILGLGLSTALAGPIWNGAQTQDIKSAALTALSRQHPFRGPLVIMPATADEAPQGRMRELVSPSTLALLPLSAPAQMRAGLRGKWRNRLVMAEASGLVVREMRGTSDQLLPLLEHERTQRRARRYQGLPLGFIAALSQLAPKHLRLFSAYADKRRCATMLMLRHGTTASYLMGWSDETGRRANAHNLLMWKAMTALADRGAKRLDLGTLDTVSASGLARFKLGTGARAHVMGGAWARILPQLNLTTLRAAPVKAAPDTA